MAPRDPRRGRLDCRWHYSGFDHHSPFPVYEAYVTVVIPEEPEDRRRRNRVVVALLGGHSAGQPWWLGYLDTGADDIVFPDAPRVTLYTGWDYVLAEAGPEQAAAWRRGEP